MSAIDYTDAEKIEHLWQAFYAKVGMPFEKNFLKRRQFALENLNVLLEFVSDPLTTSDHDRLLKIAMAALEAWSLLSHCIGTPILQAFNEVGLRSPDFDDPSYDRLRLRFLLREQERAISPLHKDALTTVGILLPRWVVQDLIASLEALDYGEVATVFKPYNVGLHGDSYSWERMRLLALEHVGFLLGQGVHKGVAQKRVAAAMKKVAPGTLRKWEQDAKERPEAARQIQLAIDAGRLLVARESNSNLGKVGSNSPIDADQLFRLQQFEAEPLTQFGERYEREFGQRHNSLPATGGN